MNPVNRFDDKTLERLSAYIDQTLDSAGRDSLERELATNAALRAELETMRRLDTAVRSCGESTPELDWERFSEEARGRREAWDARAKPPTILRFYRPLAAAAAIAIVVTAGVLMRDESPTTTTPPGSIETTLTVVTVDRLGPIRTTTTQSIAIVSVSRSLPPDAVATVGPAPRGRSLVITVGGELARDAGRFNDDDEAALF